MQNQPQNTSPAGRHSNKLIEASDLLFVWQLILKNLAILIIVPLLSFVIGYIYTHRLTSIYGARVQLLLKSNDTYDYQDPIYKGLGAYDVYMDVQNQMRILKSKDLIGEVVDKLDIDISYYFLGRLSKKEVFETLPFKADVVILNNQLYEVPVSIRIIDQDFFEVKYETAEGQKAFKGKFEEELDTEDFILLLKRQYTFDANTLSLITDSGYEIVFHSRDYLIEKYKNSLTVENQEFTSILDISITDEIQARANMFLDTLTATYIDYSLRVQLEVNQNTLENIDRQIDTSRILIREKENDLLTYRDQNAILDVSKENDEFFKDYVEYSRARRELEERKSSIISLENYLNNSDDERVLPPSFYIEEKDLYLAEAVSKIRSKQVDLELRRNNESEENIHIQNLRKEIRLLKTDIIRYLQNLEEAIDVEIRNVDAYISEYRSQIKNLPKSAQDISNIQRELEVNNKMYLFLLEKKTNTLIARAGIIPQVRVIESTQSLGLIEPDKVKINRLFVLGGVVLALLIAIIRKLFFERIENVNALRNAASLPIVGGIAQIKAAESEDLIDNKPKSSITESFRTIRTNLSFMLKDNDEGKIILISSFFPGEGKTFTSANLAVLLAMGGKKTVLVDFDLHRPRVHKFFNQDNTNGISNYIIGKVVFDEIIKKNLKKDLDVITAGPLAPNPSELILRPEIADFFKDLRSKYDYIIIDTPPFGLLNDTFELTRQADILLVVLNTKFARKSGVKSLEDILSKYEQIPKALVLNNIRESSIQRYYNKYSYKYSYGYNYGHDYGNYYGSGYTE